jgi:nitroreductase
MDVREAISSERAVRSFAERPLESEELEQILDAGRRAPSSKNEQRWQFITCTDREHLSQLAAVGPYAGHLAGAAAAIALVVPDGSDERERESIAFDLGQCARNMMLAAWAMGIGSVHATVYDDRLARELLGYPEGHRCRYLLSFGYPANSDDLTRPLAKGGRKALETLVHAERW